MIGFGQMVPVLVVGAIAFFATPKIWDKLKSGVIKAAKDTKELSSELSDIATEDARHKHNKKEN